MHLRFGPWPQRCRNSLGNVYVTRDDFLDHLARSGLAAAIKLGLFGLHNPWAGVAYRSFMIYPQIY